MNPVQLVPIPDSIPVPQMFFDILLVGGFALHILLMNAVLGAVMLSILQTLRGDDVLPRDASRNAPTLLALTINLGVVPLLFLQVGYGHFDYPASVLMGGWWLAVIPVLGAAYASLYVWDFRYSRLNPTGRLFFLLVALASMFYVGFMFSNNMTLMLTPEKWLEYFTNDGGLVLNLSYTPLVPRFLHFMVGAAALGGLFCAISGKWSANDQLVKTGMRYFTLCTGINIVVGVWFLLAIPSEIMNTFIFGYGAETLVLGLGVALAAASLYTGHARKVRSTALLAVGVVFLMSIARHFLRAAYLEQYMAQRPVQVVEQYSPMFMFLASLAIGTCVVIYLVRMWVRSGSKEA